MGVCCGGLQATYKNKHYLFVHKTNVLANFSHFFMLCPCFNSVSTCHIFWAFASIKNQQSFRASMQQFKACFVI